MRDEIEGLVGDTGCEYIVHELGAVLDGASAWNTCDDYICSNLSS